MKIRNYTSEVPAARSVGRIEALLVEFGAKNISKAYDDHKTLEAIMFDLPRPDGNSFAIKLPAHVEKMVPEIQKLHPRWQLWEVKEQAERTAWKLMTEWVEIQLSLIQMQQAEPLEIFMPYVYCRQRERTYYELVALNGFKALPEPAKV